MEQKLESDAIPAKPPEQVPPVGANRQYKDRMFRFLFGSRKDYALSLYNAVNGSSYAGEDEIQFSTMGDFVYLGMRNDVSFLFELYLNVYEHQSSPFRNLPLRGVVYLSRQIEGYLAANNLTNKLYGSKLVQIPTPKYVVFYNGLEKIPDRMELKLSDAFVHSGGCLELKVTVYNINEGHNREMMEKCRPLYEYAVLVGKARRNLKEGLNADTAVRQAVDVCIREGILADILLKHKAEVVGMMLTEYDEAAIRQAFREEGYEEGREQGREEERLSNVRQLMEQLGKGASEVMDLLRIPVAERGVINARLSVL